MSPTHYLKVKDVEFILLRAYDYMFTVGVDEMSASVRLAILRPSFVGLICTLEI